MLRRLMYLCVCLSLFLLVVPVFAQGNVPSVSVNKQLSLNEKVLIASTFAEVQGFVVIHIDNGQGQPGRVAGFAPVNPGWTYNLEVPVDTSILTPTSFAMLHVDDGTVGEYEFDGQSGLDNPVIVDGEVVTPAFEVDAIHAHDQFVDGDTVEIASVTSVVDGWLVIHSDANGAPGPVLGQTQVLKGVTTDVEVTLQADGRTTTLWPMLHVDTGTPGEYEFGAVEGADAPVIVRGQVAVLPIWTVPHVRVENQIVLHGDNQGAPNTSLEVHSVLAEVAGFLVIHVDNNGAPGPVAGFVAVPAGLSEEVTLEGLDASKLTPVLWPMLHVDDNTAGEYEFGAVEGADGPVIVNGNVLAFPINAAPSLVLTARDPLPGESTGTVRVRTDEALIDAQGWLAIHADNNGQPGPVLGVALLHEGSNKNVIVEVDGAAAGARVFPMLHYDTSTIGEYEFGSVDGADSPVFVNGVVVVSPLPLSADATVAVAEPTAEPTEPVIPASTCTVTPRGTANLRSSPTTAGNTVVGALAFGATVSIIGQTTGGDGFVWFQTADGTFVRSDVVTTAGDCTTITNLPSSVDTSAPTIEPNATPEVSS